MGKKKRLPDYEIIESIRSIDNPEKDHTNESKNLLQLVYNERRMKMEIIDPIFNLHKVKFDTLNSWKMIDSGIDRVIVYINLDNVFKMFMTPRTNNFIQASSSISEYEDEYMKMVTRNLVANIINLAQHYRLWLAKKSLDSKIILYWNYPLPDTYKNSRYIPTYRAKYNDRFKTNMGNGYLVTIIDEAISFCKKCIPYVNEVYLVDSGEIESSVVPIALDTEVFSKDNIPTKNIIVSSSSYDFSYVNYGFDVIVPPMRKKEPYRVTKDNVIEILKGRARVSSPISTDHNFVEFILSLLGDTDRDIPSIIGIGIVSIIKMLETAVANGLITYNTKDIEMLSGIIKSDYKDIFIRNYHSTSLEYQLKDIEPLDIHKITSSLVDNYDETTLNEMNEKYFKLNPIEIIRPMSEQVLYDHNPYKSIFNK